MGKLIVIEGLDGSGKSTQLDLLTENLKKNGIDCKTVSFPDYDNPSSTLVKMYLKGEYTDDTGIQPTYLRMPQAERERLERLKESEGK